MNGARPPCLLGLAFGWAFFFTSDFGKGIHNTDNLQYNITVLVDIDNIILILEYESAVKKSAVKNMTNKLVFFI